MSEVAEKQCDAMGTPKMNKNKKTTIGEPPDGGVVALLVMIGSFLCNGILFGVINTYSVIYEKIYEHLNEQNVTEASSKAAMVGSLAMGTTFMISPVSGVLTDALGIRKTTFLGGALSSLGMFLSSFCHDHIYALYFTYSIMYGLGCALTYTPSLAILGHYFKQYIGIVNGVVTTGSAVFTAFLPHVISWFLDNTGLSWTLRMISLMSVVIILASFLFRPLTTEANTESAKVSVSKCVNVSIFRNRRYLIWSVVLPLSLFGYFVPYVHMMKFVEENYGAGHDGKWPVICMAVGSGVGRLIFGYISDFPCVNRIQLQQLSLLVMGSVTSLLPSTAGSFATLICLTLLMGLFDGCFVAMLGPIAFELCGQKGAAQGIGMLLGLCSVPLTLGPYLGGILYDHLQSYQLAFQIAGLPLILGSFALCSIRCVDDGRRSSNVSDSESRVPLQTTNGKMRNGDGNGYLSNEKESIEETKLQNVHDHPTECV